MNLQHRFPKKYWFGGWRMDTNRYRRAIKSPPRNWSTITITTTTGRRFCTRENTKNKLI